MTQRLMRRGQRRQTTLTQTPKISGGLLRRYLEILVNYEESS